MKRLVACKQCHAQYDVSGYNPQDNLHCYCGAVLTVPTAQLRDARIVRCPCCGATRNQDQQCCEYCGARFSSADKGWGSMCPVCLCRLPSDAQFCIECGLKLEPRKLENEATAYQCPRCTVPLQTRQLEQIKAAECPACAGLWLSTACFETVCREREAMANAMRGLSPHGRMKFELTEDEKVRYIPCPVCKNLMNRHNFGRVSGVIIDTCRDHGVWLDNQELARIIQFIQTGGLERTHELEQREQEERRSESTRRTQVMVFPACEAPIHPRPHQLDSVLSHLIDGVVRSIFK